VVMSSSRRGSDIWRTGLGKRFWTGKDPGHSQGNTAAPKQSWRQRKQRGAVMRKQHGGAAGSPRGSPKNVFGGGTRVVWRSQVGDLCQLPVITRQAPCYAVEHPSSPYRSGHRARCHEAGSVHLVSSASPQAGIHGTSLTHGVPGSPAQPSEGYSTLPHWPGYGEHSTR
jgi:hypothetical protein